MTEPAQQRILVGVKRSAASLAALRWAAAEARLAVAVSPDAPAGRVGRNFANATIVVWMHSGVQRYAEVTG